MMEELELSFRRYMWLNHGHQGLYGDDGQMQCGHCFLDFKTAPLTLIQERLNHLKLKRIGEIERLLMALQSISSLWPEPPNCADILSVNGINDGISRAILLDGAVQLARNAIKGTTVLYHSTMTKIIDEAIQDFQTKDNIQVVSMADYILIKLKERCYTFADLDTVR